MLDDHDRVAGLDEAVQHRQELADVVEMQAGGRLVEHVQCPAGAFLHQLTSQLDALRLAAGEGGAGLAQFQIIQAHVV